MATRVPLLLSKPPATVTALLVVMLPVLTKEPSSLTSSATSSVRLERLFVSLPEDESPLVIVMLLLASSLPSLIVTLPSAFVNLSLNFLAQDSFQVCSSVMVAETVLSPVPTLSSRFTSSACTEKAASVVRTAATSGFLAKRVALLIVYFLWSTCLSVEFWVN